MARTGGFGEVFIPCKSMKNLAPQVGFEPTTLRLTAECSAIELLRSNTLSPLQIPHIGLCKLTSLLLKHSHVLTDFFFQFHPTGIERIQLFLRTFNLAIALF